ncbi:hypothetical protein [Erythrobacter rubeus]|uniref:DUF2946 domain-containing protein n=1 Tax=Erythrobacter rubeus TaxID=2760803 RepID=A0ABR8KNQ5_9SPHN|nr:hypothetical protein [Erythrobacter rubeus]MBD2842260.1 hypothetical protein [Erythrobacter rubeus]
MAKSQHPVLLALMVLAIAVRSAFGAPCCMEIPQSDQSVAAEHAHHSVNPNNSDDPHGQHGDNPSANPCCSACGPTLPPESAPFAALAAIRDIPESAPIRALKTRPPFPAYEATGPPFLT